MKKIHNTETTIWLFDYDLTLYGRDERIVLDRLDLGISHFVQKTLQIDLPEAHKVRKNWCEEYGTTLGGLQHHFGTDPSDYFDYIHKGGHLVYPQHCEIKKKVLLSLKGPLLIFSNGRKDWIQAGLVSMELEDVFEGCFDLEFFNWKGKPDNHPYDLVQNQLLKRYSFLQEKQSTTGQISSQIVFLEDKASNLEPARELGWTTVFMGEKSCGADYSISEITQLPDIMV